MASRGRPRRKRDGRRGSFRSLRRRVRQHSRYRPSRGRVTATYLVDASSDTGWSDAGSVAGNAVLQETDYTLDANAKPVRPSVRVSRYLYGLTNQKKLVQLTYNKEGAPLFGGGVLPLTSTSC